MALDSGFLYITIEFCQKLKDMDWFGKMDPFAIVTVGQQVFKTKTIQSGGRSPVFNETFKFNIINQNDFHITFKDEDVTCDELIGTARGDLAKVRLAGTDRLTLPVMSKKGQVHGHVTVSLRFESSDALNASYKAAAAAAVPRQQQAPAMIMAAPQHANVMQTPMHPQQPMMAAQPMMMPQQLMTSMTPVQPVMYVMPQQVQFAYAQQPQVVYTAAKH